MTTNTTEATLKTQANTGTARPVISTSRETLTRERRRVKAALKKTREANDTAMVNRLVGAHVALDWLLGETENRPSYIFSH